MRALHIVLPALVATHAHAQAPGQSSNAPGATTAPTPSPPGATSPAPSTPAPEPEPGPVLTEVDVESLALPCRKLGEEANAKALVKALGARLSLASCLADAAMTGLSLIDGEESVLVLEQAMTPSRALLDEVIAHAGPENQLLAQRALTVLYAGAASRMLSTVPSPVDGTDASQALRDVRLANVETMISPWRAEEGKAHAAIVKLADAYPRLARDRALAPAIQASRAQVSTPIATRP